MTPAASSQRTSGITCAMEAADGWIDGVTFPATKLEVIDMAEEAGAPQEAVERLQRLTCEQYESRAEPEAELGSDAWAQAVCTSGPLASSRSTSSAGTGREY